jgi:protein required for attachment to host cells
MSSFPTTWILVADCGSSRLFAWEAADTELTELDSPGSSAITATDNETFTNDLASHLQAGLTSDRYQRLILISPPEFLGILRRKLDHDVCQHIAEVIGLDMTKSSADEIRKRLPAIH